MDQGSDPLVDFQSRNDKSNNARFASMEDKETRNQRKGILPEEAVMRIVDNLDSTAVSAEAMQLTQVGFINLLREITKSKFQTLKQVKDHFVTKLDRVVLAKDYQIHCQKVISTESAKKVISATLKDSSQLFNTEVTKLLI